MAGFTPDFETCLGCGASLDHIRQQKVRFDFKEGRILCDACMKTNQRSGMPLSKGTFKQLVWINTADIRQADRIRFSDQAIREGETLSGRL